MDFRPMRQEDQAFVYSTMLKGLYYGSSFFNRIDKEHFFSVYKMVLKNLLLTADVTIACSADDADIIRGYVIRNKDLLHWVHIKSEWRGQGLGRKLTNGATRCTHMSDKATNWDLTFMPFVL